MLIENDKILEAKEKLGDKNADLIAEILELEGYNERDKKVCCPFHNEKTPSFVYNPKAYNFKCFGGCGASVDIIDALMKKGYTFLNACKKLFEFADMQYDFSVGITKDIDYVYPKYKDFDMKQAKDYLNKRGISNDVIEYLGITADEVGNICFNFYDSNDTLLMCKVRPSRTISKEEKKPKTWCQKGSSTSNILYNMDKVRQEGTLLICEGEIDCASFIEAGWYQTCSIPLGAQNLKFIDECWDFLNKFDTIIIAGDNDEAGKKFMKEVCTRLGGTRTKYIEYPEFYYKKNDDGEKTSKIRTKDANDILQKYGKDYLLSLVLNAKETPIVSVAKLSEIQELNVNEMEGFEIGIKDVDRELMKIFVGGVTLLTGKPSAGKTTFLNQVALQSMDSGFPVFLFSRELLNGMSVSWLNNVGAGRRHMDEIILPNGNPFYVVTNNAKKEIKRHYDESFYLYKDEEGNDVDSLLASMEMCAKRRGIKTFIIDNIMTVDLNCGDNNKNEAQTNFMNRLIKFSIEYKVAIIVVAHPRKLQAGQEIGLFDVAGSSNIINLATRTISLRRITDKEKENEKFKYRDYDVIIEIVKDRIFGSIKEIPVYYDKISRRFFSNYEEFDHKYGWDNNTYTDRIKYPIKEKEQPFH